MSVFTLDAAVVQRPVYNPGNQRRYVVLDNTSWTAARTEAGTLNGSLATIRNQAEQDWIFQTFGFASGGTPQFLWTGLHYTNSNFAWISGEPANYTHWAVGEPNTFSSGTSYVALYYPGHAEAGKWADWGTTQPSENGVFNTRYVTELPGLSPDFSWVSEVGSGPLVSLGTMGMAADSYGNVIVASPFSGAVVLHAASLTSAGGFDVCLMKLNSSGSAQWIRQFGGASDDWASGVAVDADGNTYITGSFATNAAFGTTNLTSAGGSDIFLAKYDRDGSFLWARQAGGESNDSGSGVGVDQDGNVYVAGRFMQSASFGETNLVGGTGQHLFLAKYGADGSLLWARQADAGANSIFPYRIHVMTNGVSHVTGMYISGSVAFDGVTLTNRGGRDVFVAKFDSTGGLVWARQAGANNDEAGLGIAADNAGNVYLTGYYRFGAKFDPVTLPAAGGTDVFLVKYNAAGDVVWAKRAGGSAVWNDYGNNLALDRLGHIYVVGTFIGNTSSPSFFGGVPLISGGSYSVFCSKFDADGNFLWAQQNSGGMDEGVELAVDREGNAYFGGYMNTAWARFGSVNFTNTVPQARFVAKIPSEFPRLNSLLQGNQIVNSWPTNIAGFILESATSLSPDNWTPVSGAVSIVNGRYTTTNSVSAGQQFFRLKR